MQGNITKPSREDFDFYAERKRSNCFHYVAGQEDFECDCMFQDGQLVYPRKKYDFHCHRHENYEMIIPHKCYHCELNGTDMSVRTGELLLIQPGDLHMDHLDPEEPYFSFRFICIAHNSGLSIPHVLKEDIEPQQQCTAIISKETLEQLVTLFWDEINMFSGGRFNIVNSLFQVIFWKCILSFLPQYLHESVYGSSFQMFQRRKILAVFKQNMGMMPDINLFCRQTGMSRSALSRFCHANFNLPTGQAFMSYKMNYALRQLQSVYGMKIKELSDKLGFSDQFHFSKTFKHYIGVNPSDIQTSPISLPEKSAQ